MELIVIVHLVNWATNKMSLSKVKYTYIHCSNLFYRFQLRDVRDANGIAQYSLLLFQYSRLHDTRSTSRIIIFNDGWGLSLLVDATMSFFFWHVTWYLRQWWMCHLRRFRSLCVNMCGICGYVEGGPVVFISIVIIYMETILYLFGFTLKIEANIFIDTGTQMYWSLNHFTLEWILFLMESDEWLMCDP